MGSRFRRYRRGWNHGLRAEELGDIVYVDLPRVGTKVEQGKVMGSVESVKAVSDIYAPVSGEVIADQRRAGHSARKAQRKPAWRWLAG